MSAPAVVAATVRSVALAQWRLPGDRRAAATSARGVRAEALQLDLGGGSRGPLLGDDDCLRELDEWRRDLTVDTLAVNLANDVGLWRDGRPHRAGLDLLFGAVDLAHAHGFSQLHVPSFRASTIVDEASFDATAEVLAACARRAGRAMTILTESTLGADDAMALHRAVGAPTLRVVADCGNLLDAGHDPVAFVRRCRAGGVLAPTIHVKAPAGTPRERSAAVTVDLLARLAGEDVLLENDYRDHHDLLLHDVSAARSSYPKD